MEQAVLKDLNDEFEGFTGTSQYYRHFTNLLVFTDGVKAMADRYGAYWLIDVVASYQTRPAVREKPFQIWEITSRDRKAVVTMKEDDGEPSLVMQKIGFTDFPEGILKMYLTDGVLLLPSEY
jgi:uncharacterized Ntn-hydrolase superfamily protein